MEDSARGYRELAPKPTSGDNGLGHPARPDIAKQTPIQYSFKLVARKKPGRKKQHAASLITDAQKAATKTTTAVGRIVRNATVFNVREVIEQAIRDTRTGHTIPLSKATSNTLGTKHAEAYCSLN